MGSRSRASIGGGPFALRGHRPRYKHDVCVLLTLDDTMEVYAEQQ